MNAQLAAEHVVRVGPSYLYPDHATAPGLVNPDITQANLNQTICSPTWSTKTIRPPVTYTSRLKQQQLAHATDKNLITSSRSSWAATRAIPGTSGPSVGGRLPSRSQPGAPPVTPGRGEEQGRNGERAPSRGLRRHPDAQRGAVAHRHRLVQVLPGQGAQVTVHPHPANASR